MFVAGVMLVHKDVFDEHLISLYDLHMCHPLPPQPCPLCTDAQTGLYHRDTDRIYLRCPRCTLIFVPSCEHISPAEEKARYDLHRNDPADPGYRRFLTRVLTPLQERLPPPAVGLDFGCGPGPALACMCRETGYQMRIYDPWYAPDPSVLQDSYDFVTCTEVVEHLRTPGRTLNEVWNLIRPGGWLAVMTKLARSKQSFRTWHYIRDRTHIGFFSEQTFAWLAAQWGTKAEFFGTDVVLLPKPKARGDG